jgi:hypothetical protein
MPVVFPSAFQVSGFDGRKLLVIMTIVAISLTVESQIANIADFIPEQLASTQGIAAFIGICLIFMVTQFYILAFVKHNNKDSRARTYIERYLYNPEICFKVAWDELEYSDGQLVTQESTSKMLYASQILRNHLNNS